MVILMPRFPFLWVELLPKSPILLSMCCNRFGHIRRLFVDPQVQRATPTCRLTLHFDTMSSLLHRADPSAGRHFRFGERIGFHQNRAIKRDAILWHLAFSLSISALPGLMASNLSAGRGRFFGSTRRRTILRRHPI